MKLRARFGWIFVAGLMAGQTAQAQSWGPPAHAPGVAPAGWEQPYYPPGPAGIPEYCPPSPGGGQYEYAELLPDDRGWCYDPDSQFHLVFRENLRDSWFRIEYLLANIHHSNARALGGARAGVQNIADQFPVQYVEEPPPPDEPFIPIVGLAQVPTTAGIDWKNMNGIRLSAGIPLGYNWWLEGGIMGLEEDSEILKVPILPTPIGPGPYGTNPTNFLATTLTTDGLPGSRIIVYDQAFFSEYDSKYYTGDVRLVYNYRVQDEGLNIRPLIGYRHDQYSEGLAFGGTFSNISGYYVGEPVLADPVSNRIASSTNNFRDQVQFGLRTELAHRWFTLGAEPKIAFGTNVARTRVAVSNVRGPGDPAVILDPANAVNDPASAVSYQRGTNFAPTFDLALYGSANLTEWLKIRAGWNFIWVGNVAAADQGILFNEVTNPVPPPNTTADVVARRGLSDRVITAFTIGGEILLP